MSGLPALNARLDRVPSAVAALTGGESRAFRACAVAGFYVAVLVTLGGGLAAGRPAALVAAVCAVAGASFFAWALLRRALTGGERIVALEHIWVAAASVAGLAWAVGADVRATLDVMAPGLALFLAGGRIGCTAAGCCHGRPSALGIAYGEQTGHAVAPELVGARLLPVAAIEAVGLLATSAVALGLLLAAPAGLAFGWFLMAYAVIRFGLEGLRGDPRRLWLGLSRNRWWCLAQFAYALWHTDAGVPSAVEAGVLAAVFAAALAARVALDGRRGVRRAGHRDELRELGEALAQAAGERGGMDGPAPASARTSRGVTLAVSRDAGSGELHCSLCLPPGPLDLLLLRELAAAAWPAHHASRARLRNGGVLHLWIAAAPPGEPPPASVPAAAREPMFTDPRAVTAH